MIYFVVAVDAVIADLVVAVSVSLVVAVAVVEVDV